MSVVNSASSAAAAPSPAAPGSPTVPAGAPAAGTSGLSFRESWKQHRWAWTAAMVTAVIPLLLGLLLQWVKGKIDDPTPAVSRYGYVQTADNRPLRGYVSNSVGPRVTTDDFGRFVILPEWKDGSTLIIYDMNKNPLMQARLTETNGEFEVIRVPYTAAEIAALGQAPLPAIAAAPTRETPHRP